MRICAVILENAGRSFDKIYHYHVPVEFEENLETGIRVTVPFGRGRSFRTAWFLAFVDESKYKKLKSIENILDDTPLLNKNMFRLAKLIRDRYFCSYGSAISLMLPSGMKIKRETVVITAEGTEFSAEEYMINAGIDKKELAKEIEVGNIRLVEKEQRAAKARMLKTARLKISVNDAMTMIENNEFKNRKHMRVVEVLLDYDSVAVTEFASYESISRTVLKTMEKNGIVELFDKKVDRIPEDYGEIPEAIDVVLNPGQINAVKTVSETMDSDKSDSFLLYGITGSGKTEVYIRLTQKAVSTGKQVIVLVPEISLTPMMIRRFKARFPDDIAILHSRLSMGERYDQWMMIKEKRVSIALGARSCIFAPFENLGLVIIDEEHEPSFNSETTPRYSAVDVASMRCSLEDAVLVSGSATPLVEDYYLMLKRGRIIRLKERAGLGKIPATVVVDMKDEISAGNFNLFSRQLEDEMRLNIERGEQTLLFLNRRGYASFILCKDCGNTNLCSNCDISLTYHKRLNAMVCHYCGHMEPVPVRCSECGSEAIQNHGIGTQMVEEEISKKFPEASVIRMDSDATGYKNSHMNILDKFRDEKIDILIGTQMIAKGHDFPDITLVGILAADTLTAGYGFDSQERAFQLITQAAGRAGRGEKRGRAIIQAYNTDAYAIDCGVKQDYEAFFQIESSLRERLAYPPYGTVSKILFTSVIDAKAREWAGKAEKILKENGADVSGVEYAPVSRINKKYRYRIVVRGSDSEVVRKKVSDMFLKIAAKKPFDITCSIDIKGDRLI
ncbi:MAG: primosomal protein N' [Clostridiales bacterium]|nr:primosomal protein N' [Clostridiales bacterium]